MAKIIFNDRKSVMNCTVRNQSRPGAQLVIEKTVVVPDEFQFFLANGDTVRMRCWPGTAATGLG